MWWPLCVQTVLTWMNENAEQQSCICKTLIINLLGCKFWQYWPIIKETWFSWEENERYNQSVYLCCPPPTFYHLQTLRSTCPSGFWTQRIPPSIWALQINRQYQHQVHPQWNLNMPTEITKCNSPMVKAIPSSMVMSLSLASNKDKTRTLVT